MLTKKSPSQLISLSALVLLVLFFILQIYLTVQKRFIYRSRAAGGKTITVCPQAGTGCDFGSGDGIQQAVDLAQNGDTVLIKSGTYTRGGFTQFTAPPEFFRRGPDKCFLDLRGKSLTLLGEGNGSILYGEGHDGGKANVEPYMSRWGLCSLGGNITIDSLKVKEFQKGCMSIMNGQLIVKNSVIEGCDEGGISLRGTTNALLVNNYFVSVGGALNVWESTTAKVINNIFFSANIMYFIHPTVVNPPLLTVVNNIIDIGEGQAITMPVGWVINGVDWMTKLPEIKKSTFAYNLIWQRGRNCDSQTAYCDNFVGKIEADPLFIEPVADQRGMANWANFGFRDGSPAVNAGDPSIPGGRNLGVSGGPCTDAKSSMCTQYIAQNSTVVPTPTPTLQPGLSPTNAISTTPTPKPTIPVYTPTPTPTLGPNDTRINMKVKFQGITEKPKDPSIYLLAKIKLYKGNSAVLSSDLTLFPEFGELFNGAVLSPQLSAGSDYSLFIKGAKHLQRKICNKTPIETSPSAYKCTTGSFPLTLGENYLDLSGIYQFAGDLNQDGIVDSADTSLVRNNLGKKELAVLIIADLNLDGIVDSQDYSLVLAALRIRFDDEK